jgi:hypothetical protein
MPRASNYWTYVYFFQSTAQPHLIKIGHSSRPLARYKQLMTGCPVPLVPVFLVKAHRMLEEILHIAFADQWAHGEWFNPHANLKALVRGWKSSKVELLTPQIAFDTIPPLATSALSVRGMDLTAYIECYADAFDADGLRSESRSSRRPTLAWRSTLVVKST